MMSKSNLKIDLANRLKMAREQAGLTQKQAADLTQMHRPTISEIESARRKVSAEELEIFSDIYDVSIAWLMGEADDDISGQMKIAARELNKLKPEDRKKILDVLKMLNTAGGSDVH